MPKTLLPRDVCRGLISIDGEQFPPVEEYAFQHVDWEYHSAYGLSAASSEKDREQEITIGSQDCFNKNAPQLTPNAVFNIASITKPFTVATILRMIESEEFSKYFPQKLNTKLSSFKQLFKNRYPNSNYVNQKLDAEDERIELKDLIMHISGIGEIEGKDWYEKLAFPSEEELAKPIDGKFLDAKRLPGEYGKYQYTDVGYELLGMLVSAIATDARKKTVTFGEISRELVIDRLQLKQTFAAEELSLIDGEVKITNAPEQEVAQAYACKHDGTLVKSLGFRRCMSTSGMYSNPSDLCKFAQAVFSDKTFSEGGLFEKPETLALRDSFDEKVNQCGEDGTQYPKDFYGIGFMSYRDSEGRKVRYHGATTPGYSGRVMFRDDGKASACLVSCQQITIYFAKALLDSELKSATVENSAQAKQWRFQQINKELLEKYSKEELVEALEKAKIQKRFGQERETVKDSNDEALLRELKNLDLKREKSKGDQSHPQPMIKGSGERLGGGQEGGALNLTS